MCARIGISTSHRTPVQSLLKATEIARAANPSVSSHPPRRTVPTGTVARTVKRRSSPMDEISASSSDGSSRQQAQYLRSCFVACRCNNE